MMIETNKRINIKDKEREQTILNTDASFRLSIEEFDFFIKSFISKFQRS